MTKDKVEIVKEKCNISNALFIIACLFLAVYGKDFVTFSGKYLIGITLGYIVAVSIFVGKIDFDLKLLFLAEAFMNKAILDLHSQAFELVPVAMVSPVLMYMFGKMIVSNKAGNTKQLSVHIKSNVAFIALAIGIGVGAWKVRGAGINPIFLFENSFVVSVVVAAIAVVVDRFLNKNDLTKKVKKWLVYAVLTLGFIVFIKWYVGDDRFLLFKEGLGMLINTRFVSYEGLNANPAFSTMMWFDYVGHYGQLIGIPLLVFLGLTIVDVVKLARNKNVQLFTKVMLIMAFIFTNTYYFLEGVPYLWPCFWYIGLVVNGMISVVAKYENQ